MAEQTTSQGGDQGTGSAAAGTATPASSATSSGASGTPSQQTSSQTDTRTGAPSGFTYRDDRSNWIPPHRLSEETTKRQTLEAQLKEAQGRIAALAGVTPTDPKAEKNAQVREAFFQMFPQFRRFAELSDDQLKELLDTPNRVQRVDHAEQREWTRLGNKQISTVQDLVAEAIGAEKLTADQADDVREGFATWFRARCAKEIKESGGESCPTLERYENSDPALLQDFVKRHLDNWVEPARRRVTQQTIRRTPPVPDSRGRGQVSSIKRPEKFNSLDERLDYAVGIAKERGVQFGN